MHHTNIRPYKDTDKEELIKLMRLNTPQYFDPSEESEFASYLENELESYYVVEENGEIVGCGGINYFPDEHTARISWDMIHPESQGKGIGKKLALFRIDEIKRNENIKKIVVRTTQLVYPFYQKAGFALEKTEKDFWAPGYDLYQMKIELN
ncbi:GNAT family N-acetyltransferase [Fulvivirga sp. 29W222]|uniref:GNAT family N-acetyltransferase n=1 Tax=Fulvivirga marina TaxID=2494733 RepID=A0A937FZE1_9BACT|nr:GNAT family N-acetyltransferase [Fulvivirga marina]MBL6447817.1 GNAT family N-acetyltransferase [Fulvivirga marina]